MSKQKRTIEPRTCNQTMVFECLGRARAEEMMAAGWLKPRVNREPESSGRALKIFAVEDVRRCEDRILAGEYPETK